MYGNKQMAILPLLSMLWICENFEFAPKELLQTGGFPIWPGRHLEVTAAISH